MIYSLTGTLSRRAEGIAIVSCGGVGYKVFVSRTTASALPRIGEAVTLYTHLVVKEDAHDLYGFLDESALRFFELLITVSGVGPKTALGVIDLDLVPNVMAAILERRVDLLTRASGIGKKTAERIILELQSRVAATGVSERTQAMDRNREVEEALVTLGYLRADARRAVGEVAAAPETPTEERLRAALKALGRK